MTDAERKIKNERHIAGLKKVNTTTARKVAAVIRDLEGHGLRPVIIESLRTKARQKELYAKGRTTPPIGEEHCVTWTLNSPHLTGRAVDCWFLVRGTVTDKVSDRVWGLYGKAARAHGMVWGGDWRRYDAAHIEWQGDRT